MSPSKTVFIDGVFHFHYFKIFKKVFGFRHGLTPYIVMVGVALMAKKLYIAVVRYVLH